MYKTMKKVKCLLIHSLMLIMLINFTPVSASTNLPSEIYLSQEGSNTCTLASAAMMLRARMYLSGNSLWSSITESGIKSVAWSNGLKWSWSYSIGGNSMSVAHTSVSGISVASLKALLDSHPEGVVIHVSSIPHAVFVTDYVGDTFYCADPIASYSGKSITLASSYLGKKKGSQSGVLSSVTAYWYVSSYSINSDAPKENNPIGYLDFCSGGEGVVNISGWASDADEPDTGLEIHVYIGGPAGASGVEGHSGIYANQYRSDVGNHGYSATIRTNKVGIQEIYVYAINVGSGNNVLLGSGTVTITENQNPVISNVRVENLTSQGYTVYCDVSDNTGISSVKFPTWTNNNGQDDLQWHEGTVSGNVASCTINISDHNNETNCHYTTHIYVDDTSGNSAFYGLVVFVDSQNPVISNVKIENVDSSGFDISCKVVDNYSVKMVKFPAWTKKNGQDDLKSNWTTNDACNGTIDGEYCYYHVDTGEHNDETGMYYVHIYAYDKSGNRDVVTTVVYVGEEGYGLTPIITETYNEHTYLLFEGTNSDGDKLMDWTEAAAYCQSIGGTLACIDSEEENAVVASMVSRYGNPCWIGGNDLENEGEFVWETGEDFSYTNWGGEQPDNYGGQDFVRMYTNGRWDDSESSHHAFICELVTPGKSISECSVILSDSIYTYDGTAKMPDVTVKDGENTLAEGKDYKISYSANTNAGTASVIITGIEKYKGEITRRFTINKANQAININVSKLEIKEGEEAQISASAQETVEFVSIYTDVATVNSSGIVTGKSIGDAVITVTAAENENYYSAQAAISVRVNHAYDEGVVNVKATCTENGTCTYTCNVCGKTYTEVVKAAGHSYEETIIEANCIEKGYTIHRCSACGDNFKDNYGNALGHDFDEGVITIPATGETNGVKTYTCSRCGEKKAEVIPAIEHTYDDGMIIQEATCTEPGSMLYQCTSCDKTYTVEIPAEGHPYQSTVTEPTCVKKGYTTHTCTKCGDTYKDTYTDTKAHSYDNGEVVEEPACTEEGLKIYTCSVCKNQYTESIAEKGHQYEETVVQPTCTKKGYTAHVCLLCGNSYRDTFTEEAKHSYNNGEITEIPTCTREGTKVYTCTVCRNQYTEFIAAKGHQYEEAVTAPACTQKGYTTYTCLVCEESYRGAYVDALGHAAVTDEGKEISCTESGLTEGSHCSRCGTVLKAQVEIQALGHSYGEWVTVKEAGCTDEGGRERSCEVCGEKETAVIEAAGHTWDAGVITAAPECENSGIRLYTCTSCGETRTEAVSAAGHTIVKDGAKAVSCTESGLTEGSHCSVCGAIIVAQKEIPAAGHSYGEWSITEKAACAEAGVKERICSVCGVKETEVLVALGHSWDDGKITEAATEKVNRLKTYTCKICGETRTEIIPAVEKEPSVNQPEKLLPFAIGTVVSDIESGGFYRIVSSNTVEYQKPVKEESADVIIPDTVVLNGVTCQVTSIAANAFKNNKKVLAVNIGKNITTIGSNAFSGCSRLKKVTIGNGVTVIGAKAFYRCASLTKITIPAKVSGIGKQAFGGCKKLKNIIIKSKKLTSKSVGSKAFKGIHAKAVIKAPASKLKNYKKLLKMKGAGKKVQVKK